MQNLIYNEAPYDVLYYDANLDAYRTDRFAGWQNMPENGTPMFTYGDLELHAPDRRHGRPEPAPSEAAAPAAATRSSAAPRPATPAPSAAAGSTSGGGSNTLLIGGLVVLVVIVIVGGPRRQPPPDAARRRRRVASRVSRAVRGTGGRRARPSPPSTLTAGA